MLPKAPSLLGLPAFSCKVLKDRAYVLAALHPTVLPRKFAKCRAVPSRLAEKEQDQ